jgi:2-alkenal reductase
MTTKLNPKHLVLTLFAALALSACGLLGAATNSSAENTASDPAALVAQAVATLEAQFAAQPASQIVAVNGSTQLADSDLEAALISVYAQANPGVVYILVSNGTSGSGFVYSADGYIVTNNHVVSGGRDFEVVFATGERRSAEVVGSDVDSDLAVLQVEDLPAGVTPLPLADDSLQVGQFVVAIGNPFGEQGSMSFGIVSGLGRSLPSQRATGAGSSYSLPEVIQTDAPINPGNSGGPLLNLAAEVVGINAAIASTTGANSGVGFSIPVSVVRLVVPRLIDDGAYEYAYMGASFDAEVSLDELSVYGLDQTQGAYVISVTPGSPADDAGLIAANANTGLGGDLVVAIDDQAVNNFADLNRYLVTRAAAGQTVELTVLRSGRTVTLALTLGARP